MAETEIGEEVAEIGADRALGLEEETEVIEIEEIEGDREAMIEAGTGIEIGIEEEMSQGPEVITKTEETEGIKTTIEGERDVIQGIEMTEVDRTPLAHAPPRKMIEMIEEDVIDLDLVVVGEAIDRLVTIVNSLKKEAAHVAMTTETIVSLMLFGTTTTMVMKKRWMKTAAINKKSKLKWTETRKR